MTDVTIQLTEAQTNDINAGGSLIIKDYQAKVVTPPAPTPPATSGPTIGGTLISSLPQSGANVIYNGVLKGAENWQGDWDGSGSKENYDASLEGLTVLQITAVDQYPYWLPYPKVNAAGIPSLDPTPYKNLTIIMKPTGGNADTLNVSTYTYTETGGKFVGDIPTSSGVTLPAYAVAPADAKGFITYKVPLAVLKATNPLYKIILQDASTQIGQSFDVAYAGFTD